MWRPRSQVECTIHHPREEGPRNSPPQCCSRYSALPKPRATRGVRYPDGNNPHDQRCVRWMAHDGVWTTRDEPVAVPNGELVREEFAEFAEAENTQISGRYRHTAVYEEDRSNSYAVDRADRTRDEVLDDLLRKRVRGIFAREDDSGFTEGATPDGDLQRASDTER